MSLLLTERNEKEISKLIGADKLFYQNLSDLILAVQSNGQSTIKDFDSSCFNGSYVTGDVTEKYLNELDEVRNNAAKNTRPS